MNATTDITNDDTKDRTIRIPLTKSSGSCFGGTSSTYAIDRTLLFENEVPTATWDGDGSPGAEWNRFCDLVNSHLRPINRLRLVVSISTAAAVVSLCVGLIIAYRGDLAPIATSSSSSSHTMTTALISFLGLGLAFVAVAIAVSCRIAGVTKRSLLAIKELCRGRTFHQCPGHPLLSVQLCDDDRATTTISSRSSRRCSYTGEGYHPRGLGMCHNVYLLLTTTTSTSTHDDDATDLELGFECVASSAKSTTPPQPPAFFFTALPNQKKGGTRRRGNDHNDVDDDGTRSMTDDSSSSSSSSSYYVDNMTVEGDIVLEMMDRIQLYEQGRVNSSCREDDEFSLTDDDDLETVAMEDVYRQSVVEVVSKTSDGAATSTKKKKKTNKKRKVKETKKGVTKEKKTKVRDNRKEAKDTKTKNKTTSKTKTTALS